jgi:transposase
MWLRNRFVTEKADNIPRKDRWLYAVPAHLRANACKEYTEALKSNLAKLEKRKHKDKAKVKKQKRATSFTMHFKSRKRGDNTIVVPLDGIKSSVDPNGRVDLTLFPMSKMVFRDVSLTAPITHDCKLEMDRLGRFYLHVPEDPPASLVPENQRNQWAWLDPGVRTFQTLYSPEGHAYKLCDRSMLKLRRVADHINKLLSLESKARRSRRYRLRRAIWRLRLLLGHLVDDMHWKTASFLCDRYDNVLIPKFDTSKMVKRRGRNIGKRTVNELQMLSHYTFRRRLLYKASVRGTNVFIGNEAKTTKTCTGCGFEEARGGATTCSCSSCGLRVDRDLAGSRNFGIRSYTLCAALGPSAASG